MTQAVDEILRQVWRRRDLPPPPMRRQIREAAGVSLRDMAEAIGVSHAAVRNWEQGATPRGQSLEVYRRLLEGLQAAVGARCA